MKSNLIITLARASLALVLFPVVAVPAQGVGAETCAPYGSLCCPKGWDCESGQVSDNTGWIVSPTFVPSARILIKTMYVSTTEPVLIKGKWECKQADGFMKCIPTVNTTSGRKN